MARYTKVTMKIKKTIVSLYKNGKGIPKLSREYGVGRSNK